MTASPFTANHLAELDARFDAHAEALSVRAEQARAALDRAVETLADIAGDPLPDTSQPPS